MLSIDQIKQVVGCIWKSVPYEIFEGDEGLIVETNLGFFDFDPIDDDADAMMVFKSLVDECKKREFDIAFRNGWIVIEEEHNIPDYGPEEHFSELFDNGSICLAYRKVMESK